MRELPKWAGSALVGALAVLGIVAAFAWAVWYQQSLTVDASDAGGSSQALGGSSGSSQPASSSSSASAEGPRVVFVGGSYTAGVGLDDRKQGAFPRLIGDSEGWTIVNTAREGAGYLVTPPEDDPDYPETIRRVVAADPDVVVVGDGRGNVGAASEELDAGVEQYFRRLREALPSDTEIVAVAPLWDSSEPPADLLAVAEAVEAGVEAVDGTFVGLEQPLTGKPALVQADGILPNDRGHAVIAQVLGDQLAGVVDPG